MKIQANSFENWLKANFTHSELKDLAEHGANTGWHDLSFYSQTTKLYEEFKEDIWELIIEESEQHGYSTPFQYLANFCSAHVINDAITMENWLVWYAAEVIAHHAVHD